MKLKQSVYMLFSTNVIFYMCYFPQNVIMYTLYFPRMSFSTHVIFHKYNYVHMCYFPQMSLCTHVILCTCHFVSIAIVFTIYTCVYGDKIHNLKSFQKLVMKYENKQILYCIYYTKYQSKV